MFLVPTQPHQHAFVDRQTSQRSTQDLEAPLGSLPTSPNSSMEQRSAPEYSQSGLPSPYPSTYGDSQSEASPADHASAAHYSSGQEARSTNYSASATPTSEYSGLYPPSSARSSSFPEHQHLQRQYHPASNHSGSSGGMAQTPTSPSSMQDGRGHQPQQVKSDNDLPIDPSITNPSPTYPSQYSPYGPPPTQDMHGSYPQSGGLYTQPRPDWGAYGHPPPMAHAPQVFPSTPTSAAPHGGRPTQVYSFVPIPGAQQHKRPRRRYEEIERMYKCGWNGCEKAYGTLNHLNAHVTMQGHGQKRTPEEFKEIRKEWKQRKKEEEAQRKQQEEQERQRAMQNAAANAAHVVQNGPPAPEAEGQPPTPYSAGSGRLPPIGYPSNQYPPPPSAGVPQQQMSEYGSPTMYTHGNYGQPPSPFPPTQQMYPPQRQ